MDLHKTEKLMTLFYFGSLLLSAIELTTIVTPWMHWTEILDTCPNYRCGCILYGISGFNNFSGSKTVFCRFASFASAPVIVISIGFGIYHCYRSWILPKKSKRNKKATYRRGRNRDENEPINNSSGSKWWSLGAVLGILVFMLLFANAVIVTDGYFKSCDQYRRTLVKTLAATGNSAKVIYDRLQCGAIFDFMDYMEPTTRPFYVKDESRHRPTDPQRDFYRGNFINTGASLQIAIVCLWFNCLFWIIIAALYLRLAKVKCCACLRSGT